jgi:hypothetical protein
MSLVQLFSVTHVTSEVRRTYENCMLQPSVLSSGTTTASTAFQRCRDYRQTDSHSSVLRPILSWSAFTTEFLKRIGKKIHIYPSDVW